MTNGVNAYSCDRCRQTIITIHVDDGVTPMMLACRAKKDCRGTMRSGFYKEPESSRPDATHEWYKPVGVEFDALSRAMKDHVERGGLDIREINRG